MRIGLQWTTRTPTDWLAVEAVSWARLPFRPEPVPFQLGGEDEEPGHLFALICQGVVFTGWDHYHARPLPFGGCEVTVWGDDPEDFPVGIREAQVWTFLPLAPDERFGGAYNTRQTRLLYADQARLDTLFRFPRLEATEYFPWEAFQPPPEARHGIWTTRELGLVHDLARSLQGWRRWLEGLPQEEILGGELRGQAVRGRYPPSQRSWKWYCRNTDLANGIHVATNEDAMNGGTAPAVSESVSLAFGTNVLGFSFVSPANEPNDANWPNGSYRCQMDVTAAGAALSYGLLTNGAAGHFARVDSGLTADQETWVQVEAAFTGTGLKLATSSIDPAAGAAGDRFEGLLAVRNAATMNNPQTLTLRLNTADSYMDGPWLGPDEFMVGIRQLCAAGGMIGRRYV